MKNRISFCVNACKKSTFRFIGGLQNVLGDISDTIRMKGCSLLQNRFILFYLNTSPNHPASFILQ